MKEVLFASCIMLLSSCGTDNSLPTDVLSKQRFTELMVEAQLIESRVNYEMIMEHKVTVPTGAYYDELLSREGISKEVFERTFDQYAADPEVFKEIFDEVLVELSKRKALLEGEE